MTTNHTAPAWYVEISSAFGATTPPWQLSTWQGDDWIDPDPTSYRLAGGGFKYSWAFADDALPPTSRRPCLLTLVLSCASAVDVPPIVEGTVLDVALARPWGDIGRDVDGNPDPVDDPFLFTWIIRPTSFRVTGLEGIWDPSIKRWMLTVECSGLDVDLGAAVDLGADDYDTNIHSLYDGLSGAYGDTYAQAVCREFISTKTPLAFVSRWHPVGKGIAAEAPEPEPAVNWPGHTLTVAEIVTWACTSTINSRHGRYILVAVGGYVASLPFDPYNDVNPDNPAGIYSAANTVIFDPALYQTWNGLAFLAEWNPSTTVTDPPFELILDGDGDIASVRDASVALEANADIMILSADRVRISPIWRREKVNSVNQLVLGGWDETGHDEIPVVQDNIQAQSRDGISSRTLPTLAVAESTAEVDGLVDARRELPRLFRRLYTSASGDGSPWSPDQIDVLTNLMTDDELNSYTDRFNPIDKQQQTILIVDVEDPANPVDAPVWATMTGCAISIADEGRLIVQPNIRPFMPRITSPAGATLDQIAATFPTKTIADFDPELTLSQLALSHI